MTTQTSNVNIVMQRHLLTVEKLRTQVREMLRCVINLHIDILVLESNVTQLIDDVKEINDELLEVQHLDALISALRDYNGPTICHEWPYPLIFKGTIDNADIALILNGKQNINGKSSSTQTTKRSALGNGLRKQTALGIKSIASIISDVGVA